MTDPVEGAYLSPAYPLPLSLTCLCTHSIMNKGKKSKHTQKSNLSRAGTGDGSVGMSTVGNQAAHCLISRLEMLKNAPFL